MTDTDGNNPQPHSNTNTTTSTTPTITTGCTEGIIASPDQQMPEVMVDSGYMNAMTNLLDDQTTPEPFENIFTDMYVAKDLAVGRGAWR